jgi:S-methylmethionine-dependent homocysteine/selenocysteine methylase
MTRSILRAVGKKRAIRPHRTGDQQRAGLRVLGEVRLAYRGDYQRSAAEFQAFHRPRVEALLDAGADLLACGVSQASRSAPASSSASTRGRWKAWNSAALR